MRTVRVQERLQDDVYVRGRLLVSERLQRERAVCRAAVVGEQRRVQLQRWAGEPDAVFVLLGVFGIALVRVRVRRGRR